MDRLGLEVCTAITLLFGFLQRTLLVTVGRHSRTWLIVSMIFYNAFRQLLFPVFIGSLTSRLGFKYFGLLNGISFALSGLTMPLMTPMIRAVSGDCHQLVVNETNSSNHDAQAVDCSSGRWTGLHLAEMMVLASLVVLPVLEYRDQKRWRARMRAWMNSTAVSSNGDGSPTYGAVQMQEDVSSHVSGPAYHRPKPILNEA